MRPADQVALSGHQHRGRPVHDGLGFRQETRRNPGAPLHTNFKLSEEGEYLALVQPDGVTIATQFYPTFPPQFPDVSYGLPPDRVTNAYLAWPTPGVPNSPGTNFIVADLSFTPGRGWYTNSVSVSIGTPTAGVTIYYTTNGTRARSNERVCLYRAAGLHQHHGLARRSLSPGLPARFRVAHLRLSGIR